ncbi:MAG: hypothetical protein E7315_01075 [Clostridiales bacterium]|nr:hypothetical protein [Clostridiales bacterium]
MSSFYILVGFTLNLIFGFLLKPFFALPRDIAVKASLRFEKKSTYSSLVYKGAFITLFVCIAAFLMCEILSIYVVKSQYKIVYRVFFIICGCFFSKAGQLMGALKKIRKGIIHNSDGYIIRCIDELLIPNTDKIVPSNYYSVISGAVVKICGEFIITPVIIGMLCPEKYVFSLLAVYLILALRGIYVNDRRILTHGYLVFAGRLTAILSYPAYLMLNIIILAFKWVMGIKADKSKEKKICLRCSDNLRRMVYAWDHKGDTSLSVRQINLLRYLTVFSLFISAVAVIAIYLFVLSVFTLPSV